MRKDFLWGTATASYQIEGAWNKDGKTPNVWDTFSQGGNCFRTQNGNVACDHYNRYKEDVKLMSELGVNSYRFSVSWSRIIPNADGKVNPKGLKFYSDLVDELLKYDIKPLVTLYHWDMPDWVAKQGGFNNRKIVDDFIFYTTVVAEKLGDRVKDFITINEPQCVLTVNTPSSYVDEKTTEDIRYKLNCGHNLLLCHGHAVRVLREKIPNVKVGIANCGWISCPVTETEKNVEQARKNYFKLDENNPMGNMAVLGDAVYLGDYPEEYYRVYKDVLPEIKSGDMAIIGEKLDYLCQNIYSGILIDEEGKVVPFPDGNPQNLMGCDDIEIALYWGIRFLSERYSLPVMITENGTSLNDRVCLDGKVHDYYRIDSTAKFLSALKRADEEGYATIGYYHWSLLDNFEWRCAFSQRFGLIYVDYATQKRTKKDSFYYYKEVIASNGENVKK